MSELYSQVGIVGIILILLAILVVTLLLLKVYQFARLRVWHRQMISCDQQSFTQNELAMLLEHLEQCCHPATQPVKRLLRLKYIEQKHDEFVDSEVLRVGNKQLQRLEQYLRPLEVLSHLAPLVGLLGTVIGIIIAFSAIQSSTQVDAGLLSSGISHALITTALGLSVAIPAQVGFHYLDGKVEKVRQMMSDYVAWSKHLSIQ